MGSPVDDSDISPTERAEIDEALSRIAGGNHYRVLGIATDADSATIRGAFIQLSRRFGPERWAGRTLGRLAPRVESIARSVDQAFRVLGDEARRRAYDQGGSLRATGSGSVLSSGADRATPSTSGEVAGMPTEVDVLLVDDDDAIMQGLRRVLERQSLRVATSDRAFGVTNLAARLRPRVIVLDVNMPGLDGPSLASLMRDRPEFRDTSLVLWSALPEDQLAERAVACRADAWMTKAQGFLNVASRVTALAQARRRGGASTS